MSHSIKPRRPSRADFLSDDIRAMSAASKLQDWNYLTESVDVPAPLAAAFVTGRPEMVKLATPTALTKEECAALYTFIGVLLATNRELQVHASRVAKLTGNFVETFKATVTTARLIDDFANFREIDTPEETDEQT